MTQLPLVQLLEHEIGDLGAIAKYADTIGIAQGVGHAGGGIGGACRDLRVHVWTFRAENEFLPADLRSGDESGRSWQPRG